MLVGKLGKYFLRYEESIDSLKYLCCYFVLFPLYLIANNHDTTII